MSDKGYVKTFRKIKCWEWYKDISVKVLFIHLLLEVEPEDTYIQGVFVKAGSTKKTVNELSVESGLTTQQTRRAIKELEKTNEITIKTTNRYTVISLVKWLDYQDSETYKNKQNNKQNNKRTYKQNTILEQTNIQTDPYIYNSIIKDKDNNKEEKKIRSVFVSYSLDNVELLNALNDYEEMRKSIKSPMTDRAKTLLCAKLDTLKSDGENIVECINNAIVNNWKSVYPNSKNSFNKKDDKEKKVFEPWGVIAQ